MTASEDIRWIRGLGGENLPAVLRVSPKTEKGLFFAIREGSRVFVACFLHSSAQTCLYQTPGRRPPRITGSFVKTATRGWVEAPNERAPNSLHGAVVSFVDRCLSRTRNLAASNFNFWLSFSRADLGPTSAQDYFFLFFWKVWTYFFEDLDLCL